VGYNPDDMLWYGMGIAEGERRARGLPPKRVDPGPPRPPIGWPLDDDLSRLSDDRLYFLRTWEPGFTPRERQRRAHLMEAEIGRRRKVRETAALQQEREFLAARQAHLRSVAQARRRAFWARLRGVFRRATSSCPGSKG
jgi:hypothetical protein